MNIKLLCVLVAIVLFLKPGLTFGQAPNLGSAANFVLFTTVGAVTNSSPSLFTGNVGSNSGSSTGFGNVNGVMDNNNGVSAAAAADLLTAYNQLNTTIPTFFPSSLLGGGDTLIAGVYQIAAAATMNGNLILDAQGNPNAVFIFQIGGSFATGANSKVIVINGGLACNVFWKVEGLVSMASGTVMRGTVIANNAGITMGTNDTLEGRALSTAGAVSVGGVLGYTPVGCGSPILTGPAAPALASTACYGLFSADGPVSNAGITHVLGDVGTNVGLTTGFDPLFVAGAIHPIPDGSTVACAADLLNVYSYLNTLPSDIELLYPAQFGNNLVLTPHTYIMNGATSFTGSVYLNGAGDSNAVFVLQLNGALTTSTFSNVILINGTQAKNVFWKVEGAVEINDYSVFNGTIVCNNGAISLNTGVVLNGRALTTTGALGVAAVTVIMPPGCTGCTVPAIGGTPVVCMGGTTTMTNTDTTGGSWSSSNTAIATVGSSTGIVTGITGGTATIAYATGTCMVTMVVTVNVFPGAGTVTGPSAVMAGSNITLTDATGGGTWSASNSNATVSGGMVHGVTAGTVTISYSVTNSCGTAAATQLVTVGTSTTTVTVGAITGYYFYLCSGATAPFFDGTMGGTWSINAADAAVASVSATGVVTGMSAGTARLSYTIGISYSTAVVTVYPVPAAIIGTGAVCTGGMTALTDATAGGVWSSGIPSKATVGAAGIVTGVIAGVVPIYYTLSAAGCKATFTVTVSVPPSAGLISGIATVCIGANTTLSDVISGGVWTSSNVSAGTVSGGVVTGVGAGTTTISYTVTAGCGSATATKIVTVNSASGGTINGASSVTAGLSISLSDATTGGVWSASNGNASISAMGLVTGVTAGTVTISYTVTTACGTASATYVITVNASGVGAIMGATSVCIGSATALTDATTGGTWHSSNTMTATVGTSGIVTGVAAGTSTISYTVGGVPVTVIVTVNAGPSSIGGTSSVCNGLSVTLSDFTTGGTWTSTGGVSVTTGTTTTTVTGLSVGVNTITYSLSTGCYKTYVVTVKVAPAAIMGNMAVCGVGSVTFLSDATSGISWTISPVGTATISPSGRVYGVSAGTAIVTYTSTNACITTAIVTVNPLLAIAPISGASNVSHGATISLSDASSFGAWSSSNTALGSVDASGNVTGVGTSGTVTITYSVAYAGGGCNAIATKPITVHTPAPHSHGATATTTVGATISVADELMGGEWTSSDNSIATVNEYGIASAIAAGNVNIIHTVANANGDVSSNITSVLVNVVPMEAGMIPNPNKGAFTVKGTLGITKDAMVTFEITNMVGQVIYTGNTIATGGIINEQVKLNSNVASGRYLLNVRSGNESKTLHFVIE